MVRISALIVVLSSLVIPASGQEAFEKFFTAVRNDDLKGLRTLLESGADVNSRDRKETTPLMFAAAYGSVDAMKLLLDRGADVNAKNGLGATALMWAAGDITKVRLLLDRNADVNAVSNMGRTALLIAAGKHGNSETVKLLVAKGAELAAKPVAMKGGRNRGAGLLDTAALSDDLETFRFLLDKGLDVNQRSEGGVTPLMNAAANGNVEMVRLLLKKGAAVNAVSDEQTGGTVKNGPIQLGYFTPLLMAVSEGSLETVKTLLDAGANVNAKDVRGYNALSYAIASDRNNAAIIRALLEKGADTKAKSKNGDTPLDWAERMRVPALYAALHAKPGPPVALVVRQEPRDLRASVAKSIQLLQATTTTFFKEGGCVACHAQGLTPVAVKVARASGLPVNEAVAAEQVKSSVLQLSSLEQILLQGATPGGAMDALSYALFGLEGGDHKPDRTTDAIAFSIALQQRLEGSWHQGGFNRPPMEDGDFTRTALCLRALQVYGPPARKAEMDDRIARAARWLIAAKPATTEDRVMQLLGAAWAGADPSVLKQFSRELIALQHADGGWAQTPHLASDAYATGSTLHALHQAGIATADPAYQRGVAFLLKSQNDDGSWHVASRSMKFQPYFQSGFPHDHDQWISSAATAWAAMALSHAVKGDGQLTAKK